MSCKSQKKIVGLCVTAFGVFLKFGDTVLLRNVEAFTNGISKQLISAGLDNVYMSNLDLVELLQVLSIPLIVIGTFWTVFSSCGIHVARKKIAVLLILYAVFVMFGLILQASSVFAIFAYRKLVNEHLKSYLLTSLHENYRGYNETNLFSQAWNIIMVKWHCCGVNNYTDFGRAAAWRRRLFQDGWWFELETPLTCCNMEKKDPDDFACAINPTDQTSYYLQGCYSAFWTNFDSNRGVLLAGNICLMTVQLVLIIASILLVRGTRQRAKKQVGEKQHEESTAEEINTNGRECTLNNGLLNHLSFLGLGGQGNDDTFQQYQSGNKRFSVSPDILTQLFSGTRRFSQMPSFDFGIPQSRMSSFDFGISSSQTPPFNFGAAQGPIIVQLPQQPATQNSALKAITEAPEADLAETKPKIDKVKITELKTDVPKIERCKSENCINVIKKERKSHQRVSDNTKPELNRRKTLPHGLHETSTVK
ncbi:tetraspanin-21-like [Mercenaria mercenaria]|uniref:tetraspanin-21-like n=1 Tax=Mercenaria mercenaria TaxID=6596 RepID=UPI00234EE612|nr:tetraspanin-21-like [Mercenaria mercenaria]